MLKKWKLLDSETVFENEWWKIVREKVELPDGTVFDDFYVNHPHDGVAIVPVTEEGKLVINRQYKHGYRGIIAEFTIGRVEDGDGSDFRIGAERELREETGYGGGAWEPLGAMTVNPTSSTSRIHFFLARGVRRLGPPQDDPKEMIETSEVTPAELFAMIARGEVVSQAMITGFMMAGAKLGWFELKA